MPKEVPTDAEMAVESDSLGENGLRHRKRNVVANAPFAGRIGGNQAAITDDEDILRKQPDAAPLLTLRDALDPRGFFVRDTWRQAAIEAWGTCLLVFILGAASSGLTLLPAGTSPLAVGAYAALTNGVGLSLFIFSAGPASGGHLNPTITMATFFAGLATLPRAVIYIAAQTVGGIVGGYWLRLGLGDAYFATGVIPGCTVDTRFVSAGQLWVLEFMFAQGLIFTAFGVGLDPRQAKSLGPALAPILVGASLALGTLASSIAKPGYTGISFNPARCIGLMTARDILQYHWVHWTAPLAAGMINGLFYYFAPPYRKEKPLVQHNPLNAHG